MNKEISGGLLLFACYLAAAVLGLQWAEVSGAGSPVWPAFGIALAGLIIGGPRLWPAIFFGRLLAGLAVGSDQPLWAEIAIAASNSLADALGAYVILRYGRMVSDLTSLRDVLWLAAGVLGSAALSATLGTATLSISSELSAAAAGEVWIGWWFGNLVAGLTITPLILTWWKKSAFQRPAGHWLHLASCLAAVTAISALVFLHTETTWLRTWHIFPVMIWAALAFNVRGSAPALVISSFIALLGATIGTGLTYALGEDVPSRVRMAQQFVTVISLTTLILAAVAYERRRIRVAAQLSAIVSSTPDAIISFAPNGLIENWNPGAEKLFGYSAEEAKGRPGSIILPNDAPDGPAGVFNLALEKGQLQLDTVRVGKSGEPIDVAISASRMYAPDGTVLGVAAVFRDIRQRKRIEDQLREQTETLEILNRTGAAVAAELDLQRLVQTVTDAGVQLSGAKFGAFFYNVMDEEGASYTLYTLSGCERSDFENFPMPRATHVFGPTFNGEGVVRSPDIISDERYGRNEPYHGMPEGHLPVRSYLAVPVSSRSGEVIGGLFFGHPDTDVFSERTERIIVGLAAQAAIAIDNARLFQVVQRANETLEQRVTERTQELEQTQDALRQAQKMEAIGQLTGGIAHDFNNLLTVIRGSADVLRRGDLPEEKRARYVEAIAETADRAASLTGQLLAFARRQALRPEVFDAAERLNAIGSMLGTVLGSRIELVIKSECNDCYLEADAAQFETAIVNMAVNARDAMDGEGRLEITVSKTDSLPVEAAPERGPWVAVAIRDTGHGMSDDQIGKIFEPFYTTKEVGKGTGLGLSQVYGFAKQSGGEIRVESIVGEGTVFTLYLRQSDRMPDVEQENEQRLQGFADARRVLIVEDNTDVGAFAEQILNDLGLGTTLASNAAEALAILAKEDGNFDVVFSDVVMPGLSGVEFAKQVRERWSHLPVVLTSGYSHALADGSRHEFPLLRKPYTVEQLTAALQEAIHKG